LILPIKYYNINLALWKAVESKIRKGTILKKSLMTLIAAIVLFTNISNGQLYSDRGFDRKIPGYYSQTDFLMTSPSVFQEGLLGFVNPANLNFLKYPESRYYYTADGNRDGMFPHIETYFKDWAAIIAVPHLSFGLINHEFGEFEVTDYQISLGTGTAGYAVGMAYGWSSSDTDSLRHERIYKTSLIARPLKYLSLGLIVDYSMQSNSQMGVADIGIRPFGNSRLTLFGDMAMREKTKFNEAPWSAGAAVEIIPGISLTGRYFRDESFTAGLTINFGKAGFGSQLYFDDKQEHTQSAYSYRIGGMRPSVFPALVDKDKRYLKINFKGRVVYQGYKFFNKDNIKFLGVLRDIQAAGDDPRIAAIALNLSSIRVAPELAWEIREELKKVQAKGKTVIVFTDRSSITSYHLASVADKIVLDPEGMIDIFGYALGNTYFKGTLAKLGLGFDEWRFFKYKSAAEILTRDSMSDAEREQYQDYTDDLYETARKDICQSRSISEGMFDYLVDEKVVFLPQAALDENLVDTLARWSDVDKIVEKTLDEKLRPMNSRELFANALPPRQWGTLPEVAVVYGLGICAMDSGIKARWLEKEFLRLANDKTVKAVVFRVDSPGGDGLASDLVAEALKKCAAKKPVIISQGQLAGSGGYWISMYGDKILAGPTSITGSIGVIGGWIYDLGFSEKLGMTSDYVKRGKHADLGYGVTVPILNITVPARNLDDEERAKMEKIIREFYEKFVGKVAAGRDMTVDEVKAVAEGHFYSGLDGLEAGLIDEIGGLMLAIEIARQQAGLKADQEISIKEIPEFKGLFGFDSPILFMKTRVEEEPAYKYIKMINEARGQALPMIPPGTYPEAE